jgi:hypothetical protein
MSKGSISKKKNPTPEKGIRKMIKKKKSIRICLIRERRLLAVGVYENKGCLSQAEQFNCLVRPCTVISVDYLFENESSSASVR